MELNELTITELKAMAYDYIAQKEDAERNILAINNEIFKKLQTIKPEENGN